MLKRYILKDVGIDFVGCEVIWWWRNKCWLQWMVTHPVLRPVTPELGVGRRLMLGTRGAGEGMKANIAEKEKIP